MQHKLPPLKPLKVFEVTARHKNFSTAARELCLTQSAVSHQIKQLEEFFGKPLLIREKRRTYLTQEGDMLLSVVNDSFNRLTAVTNHLLSSQQPPLKIISQTSVAADWLSPRLAQFGLCHPDIHLSLGMASYANSFNANEYDIIIGTWPAPDGFVSHKLCHETWYPVATPDIIEQIDPKDPADLLRFPLYSSEKSEDWNLWIQQQKVRKPVHLHMHQFELSILAVRAALGGHGIALGCGFLVDDFISQGLLAGLPELDYELPWGHYQVHYRTDSPTAESIEKFMTWLLDLAANRSKHDQ